MKRHPLFPLCAFVFGPAVRLLFRARYENTEAIPRRGRVVVCCNHRSVCDPVLLAVPFRRELRYMAKSELFTDHGPLTRAFFNLFGAFPVRRGRGDVSSVRTAEKILEAGGAVGIFPQGGCAAAGVPFRPKGGAALIAARTRSPILPAAVCCPGDIRPFCGVTVRFGRVIPFETFPKKEDSTVDIRKLSVLLAREINRLLGVEP